MQDSQSSLQLSMAMLERGRYAEAEHQAMKIGTGDPLVSLALELAAIAMEKQGRVAEGLIMLQYAASIDPHNASIQYNIWVFYEALGDVSASMMAYQTCLRIQPNHADALWNYAEQLRVRELFDQALVLLERMEPFVTDEQRQVNYFHRLAVTLFSLQEYARARSAFEKALSFQSVYHAATQWEYSHMLLALGEWKMGWLAYDYRFAAGSNSNVRCHQFPYPQWQGEKLMGKTLLIHGEQGLGDEIMFGQLVGELKREAKHIIWACRPSLARLFAHSHPEVTVLPHHVGEAPAEISDKNVDFQIPVCSLARWRRQSDTDFLGKNKTLFPVLEQVGEFDNKLSRFAGADVEKDRKFRIGVMWGANPAIGVQWAQARSAQKSIPVEKLVPLSQFCEQVQFVSLQNRDVAREMSNAPELDMIDCHRDLVDMSDTSALVANMDLVLTVDTSIAHLAGAMGKEVWILLMDRADWRWQHEEKSSIWYPTATLFRQPIQGDWDAVVVNLIDAMQIWLQDRKGVGFFGQGED